MSASSGSSGDEAEAPRDAGHACASRRGPARRGDEPGIRDLASFRIPVTAGGSAVEHRPGSIIFDWDDTLFPTWYVQEVVIPTIPEVTDEDGETQESTSLPADSPFLSDLEGHAALIERVLRAAKQLGPVAIVTLGSKPWVSTSASRWLPTLNFAALEKELDIHVVYARDCVKQAHIVGYEEDEGINLYTVAKALAMRKVVKRMIKNKVFYANFISIGDAKYERDAAKDLLWGLSDEGYEPFCKTIKLLNDPSLEELQVELNFIADWLPLMVAKREDFDLCLADSVDSTIDRLRGLVQ